MRESSMTYYLNVAVRQCTVSLIILFATVNAIAETQTHKAGYDCTIYDNEAQQAVEIMQQDLKPLQAGSADLILPTVETGRGYQLDLLPQSEVTFILAPARPAVTEEPAAGIVQFTTTKAGRYRVNISDGSWIEVLSDSGELLSATTFKGRHGCQPLRKYVEYELPANSKHTLQISGGIKTALVLVIIAPH